MPRYYFDTHDEERDIRDEVGTDLACIRDAPTHAMDLLRAMTRDCAVVGRLVVTASVRDAAGEVVYKASMTVEDWWPSRLTDDA